MTEDRDTLKDIKSLQDLQNAAADPGTEPGATKDTSALIAEAREKLADISEDFYVHASQPDVAILHGDDRLIVAEMNTVNRFGFKEAALFAAAPRLVRQLAAALQRAEARRRTCACPEPDPVMQADGRFYCHVCSFETGARPVLLQEVEVATLRQERDEAVGLITRIREKGIDVRVLADAYGWTIDVDGNIHGLTAGDMCFEPSGLQLDTETRDWLINARQAKEAAEAALKDAREVILQLHMECLNEGHCDSGEMGDPCRQRGQVIRCGICAALEDARKALAPFTPTGEPPQ